MSPTADALSAGRAPHSLPRLESLNTLAPYLVNMLDAPEPAASCAHTDVNGGAGAATDAFDPCTRFPHLSHIELRPHMRLHDTLLLASALTLWSLSPRASHHRCFTVADILARAPPRPQREPRSAHPPRLWPSLPHRPGVPRADESGGGLQLGRQRRHIQEAGRAALGGRKRAVQDMKTDIDGCDKVILQGWLLERVSPLLEYEDGCEPVTSSDLSGSWTV
ncbi:hypothetical protein B0H19DRAFT_1247027 [Mycena capillaripes]|nr:hypothetical protein B0H19DRAFT_1247027 [Mycena capillaripes]